LQGDFPHVFKLPHREDEARKRRKSMTEYEESIMQGQQLRIMELEKLAALRLSQIHLDRRQYLMLKDALKKIQDIIIAFT